MRTAAGRDVGQSQPAAVLRVAAERRRSGCIARAATGGTRAILHTANRLNVGLVYDICCFQRNHSSELNQQLLLWLTGDEIDTLKQRLVESSTC